MQSPLLFRYLINVLSLVELISASAIPDLNPSAASVNQLNVRDGSPWPYGVMGDSWGSGVSYNEDVLYDGNLDNCLRTKESHGPQLEGDNRWTDDTSGLKDAACSGSVLFDLANGTHQLGKLGNPDMVVMTSGGNNAGFGNIVEVCIYHPEWSHNYGPIFTNVEDLGGECGQALNRSLEYITNQIGEDLNNTMHYIFEDAAVKDNPNFLLYVTGYAQFFGTDYDPWCNNEAWNIAGISPTPYLTKELRTEINSQISKVNAIYKNVVETTYPKQARFVYLDPYFSGHRFCEPGASRDDQFNTDTHFEDVYLWNLNWPYQVANQPGPTPPLSNDGLGQFSQADASNFFGDDHNITAWSGGSEGGNVPSNGWRLRPFHPRYSGYTRFKDAILDQMKADKIPPTTTNSNPPATTSSNPPGPSCSHVGNGFQCQCSDGSTPDPDEDNRCCLYHQPNGNDQCFDN